MHEFIRTRRLQNQLRVTGLGKQSYSLNYLYETTPPTLKQRNKTKSQRGILDQKIRAMNSNNTLLTACPFYSRT